MSNIGTGPAYQPVFWAIGLFIYALIAASLAVACGALAGGVGYLLFRRSRGSVLRIGVPCLIAISTLFVVFVVIFSIVCLSFFGVFATPDERLLTPIRPVSEEDIVGTWSLDSASLQRMEEEGGYEISTHTLTFRDDGTFEMVNMPDWCQIVGDSAGDFVSSAGTWRITEHSGEWGVFVHFAWLPDWPDGMYTVFEIGGQEPPYHIWTYAGSPDAGRVMVFEKQREGP